MTRIQLFLLLIVALGANFPLQAQSPHNAKLLYGNWKVISLDGEEIPGDLNMMMSIDKTGQLILTAQGGQLNDTASWEMNAAQSHLKIGTNERDENWEIIKLDKSNLTLKDEFEKVIILQKAGKKVKKKKLKKVEKKILGNWEVIQIDAEDIPQDKKLSLKVNKDNTLSLSTDGEVTETGTWTYNKEIQSLKVLDDNSDSPEIWKILLLEDDQLIFKEGMIVVKLKRIK